MSRRASIVIILPEFRPTCFLKVKHPETVMHIRRFALGVVAAFISTSAAHAVDAVVPDEFEQQPSVSACDAYGTGFAKLPGTNTCVKVSGKVSYEKRFSGSDQSGGRVQMNFETRSD